MVTLHWYPHLVEYPLRTYYKALSAEEKLKTYPAICPPYTDVALHLKYLGADLRPLNHVSF